MKFASVFSVKNARPFLPICQDQFPEYNKKSDAPGKVHRLG